MKDEKLRYNSTGKNESVFPIYGWIGGTNQELDSMMELRPKLEEAIGYLNSRGIKNDYSYSGDPAIPRFILPKIKQAIDLYEKHKKEEGKQKTLENLNFIRGLQEDANQKQLLASQLQSRPLNIPPPKAPTAPYITPSALNRQRRINISQNEPIQENPETPYSQQATYFDEGEGSRIPAYVHSIGGKLNIVRPIESNPETPYTEKPQYFDETQRFAHGGAVMNPALMQMAFQQQAPQSPIMSGANQGIDAARNSMRMGDEDRQRALGLAMMHFGRNINNPAVGGEGFSGALARMSGALGPATDAYMDYEREAMNRNMALQKMEQERLHQEARDRLEKEKLEEMKRYHSGMMEHRNKLTKDERMYQLGTKKAEILNQKYPGAVPFELMTPSMQKDSMTYLRNINEHANDYGKIVEDLHELKDIVNKYPNLSTSVTAAFYPEGKGFLETTKRSLLNQDERFAIDRSKKLVSDLLGYKIQSSTGQRMTDLMKKIFGESLPDLTKNTNKANNILIDEALESFEPMHDYSRLTPDMISNQFILPKPIPKLKRRSTQERNFGSQEPETQKTSISPNSINDLNGIDKRLEEIRAMREQMSGAQQ